MSNEQFQELVAILRKHETLLSELKGDIDYLQSHLDKAIGKDRIGENIKEIKGMIEDLYHKL